MNVARYAEPYISVVDFQFTVFYSNHTSHNKVYTRFFGVVSKLLFVVCHENLRSHSVKLLVRK